MTVNSSVYWDSRFWELLLATNSHYISEPRGPKVTFAWGPLLTMYTNNMFYSMLL